MSSFVWKKALDRAYETYERYISNDLDIEQVARLHGMVAMSEMVDPVDITERKVLDYLAALQNGIFKVIKGDYAGYHQVTFYRLLVLLKTFLT